MLELSMYNPTEFLGLDLQSPQRRFCGVCGNYGELSRTHVPPKHAGNAGATTRQLQRIVDGAMVDGRPKIGGIWVRGLCKVCNSLAGGNTDAQYGDFAKAIRRWMGSRLSPANNSGVPPVDVSPGPVARSVLYGMHALNPKLRELYPSLAEALARGEDEITLPGGMRLYVALYPNLRARVTGPIHAYRVLTQSEAYMTFAEIYFDPLAWVLAPDEPDNLFSRRGWVDASEWSRYSRTRSSIDLRWLTTTFAITDHPLLGSDEWFHLYSNEITPIVEGRITL